MRSQPPVRRRSFTTISGRPIERVYTAAGRRAASTTPATSTIRAVSLHPRHPPDRLPRQAVDDAAVRRVRHAGRDQRSATRRCSKAGGTGLSVAFDLPTLMGRDPDHELSLGEVGKCGVSIVVARRHGTAVRRHLARRHHDVDDDQLAGADDLRDVPGRSPSSRAPTGRRSRARSRTTSSRSSSRRRNTSSRRGQSMRLITDIFAFCATEVPEVEHDLGQRVPHPRGGIDGGAGTGVHAARRHRVRAVRRSTPASTSTTFAPRISFFFNSHSDFFEEIAKYPRRAPASGREVMRDRFKREERAIVEAALSHADGRRVAHRAAAVQQRRPHGAAGAGGRARRHAVAAHELARRGARAADGRGRDAGAAHAADHRARERRDERGRSARRLVLRRAADARHGTEARQYFDIIDRMGGMVEAIEQGFPQREIAEASYRFQQAVEAREKVIVGVNEYVQEDERADPDPLHRRDARPNGSSRGSRTLRRTRDNAQVEPRARGAAGHRARAPATRCTRCWTASAPTRPSARCATRCATSGASTRKCPDLSLSSSV